MDQFTVVAVLTKTYVLGSSATTSTGTNAYTLTTSSTSTSNSGSISESTSGSMSISSFVSTTLSLLTTVALKTASLSNIGASQSSMVATFSSGSGTNIGLAVGIPIAVLALFILGGFGWWVWKKKQFSAIKKEELPYVDENWRAYSTPKGFNGLENPSSSIYSSSKPSLDAKFAMKYNPAQRTPLVERNLLGKALLQKLRMAEFKQSTPQTPLRMSQLISPIFLKPFNLTRLKELKELPPTPLNPNSMKQNEKRINRNDTASSLDTNNSHLKANGSHDKGNKSNELNSNIKNSNFNPYNPKANGDKSKKTTTKSDPKYSKLPLDGFENVQENVKKQTISRPPSDSDRQVIRAYQKLFDYELSVEPGDEIKVLEFHSDGWCLVRNKSGETGLVPKLCLKHKSSSKSYR